MPVMPNLLGLPYPAAQVSLQSAGILVLSGVGYFTPSPVTPLWQRSRQPPSTVLAQSIAAGSVTAANAPLTLTLAQFPMSIAT